MHLQGKYTSDTFRYSRIGVTTCNPTSTSNTTCATTSEVNNFITASDGVITVQIYFVNTVINSGS